MTETNRNLGVLQGLWDEQRAARIIALASDSRTCTKFGLDLIESAAAGQTFVHFYWREHTLRSKLINVPPDRVYIHLEAPVDILRPGSNFWAEVDGLK